MAQIVKLRRSAVPGKKPTNANLQLGELSINTTDGKVFFAVSGALGPSIQELVATNTVNTGSIYLTDNVTASFFTGSFIGDGQGLYNIPASGITGLNLSQIANGSATGSIDNDGLQVNVSLSVTGSITATEFTGSGLGLTNVPFHISGSDVDGNTYDKQFTKLQFDDSTGLNVSESFDGTAFVSIGSHFRDIFVQGQDLVRATGSDVVEFIGEGGLEITTSMVDTNSNGYIKEVTFNVSTLSASLVNYVDSSYPVSGMTRTLVVGSQQTTWSFQHNLDYKYPAINVFDSNDKVIIPTEIKVIDDNNLDVYFALPTAGTVIATIGGNGSSGTSGTSGSSCLLYTSPSPRDS